MGRPKGGHNRTWTNEERLRIVQLYESGQYSRSELSNKENVPEGTLDGWYRRYLQGGIEALNPTKLHTGNPYAALHTAKELSVEERQRLEILKLRVENERLKKGYMVKGVGADKEFVTLKELNSR
jgi:transposase-like protein